MANLTEIGNRIELIRKELNINQKEFAQKLNISPPTLSEIENGNSKPGFGFLVNISEKLNVNLYYLLFGQGDMFTDPVTSFYHRKSNFGVKPELIREFLYYFRQSKLVQYYIMGEFSKLMIDNKLKSIKKEIELSGNK